MGRRTKRIRSLPAAWARARQGQPPGSAVYAGEPRSAPVRIAVIDYDQDLLQERESAASEAWAPPAEPRLVRWVDVDGVHDARLVQALCESFGVHPLAMEDVLNPATRPKADAYGDTLFAAVKMAGVPGAGPPFPLAVEHVALILGPNWVLSFQERTGDVFDPVRRRLRSGTGRLMRSGADCLFHALLDAIVDAYFVVLEQIEDRVEAVEEHALEGSSASTPAEMHGLQADLRTLQRAVWPLREAVGSLLRGESALLQKATVPYLRDLYDHVVQVMDVTEALRERLVGVHELHLVSTGNRMNQAMRVLTVVATVFIPLTFVAGVYGMNFRFMPELETRWGYPAVLVAMALIAAGMLAWFRRRRWI